MPYLSNDKLPPAVRSHLPPEAQSIYREAFNHAWKTYARDVRQEEIAHRVAWAAVKRRFRRKEDGHWVRDQGLWRADVHERDRSCALP
jgi:cation transport regulator